MAIPKDAADALIAGMRSGVEEITRLRRANEVLAAQVRVIEVFERALFGAPRSQGMSEDPAWRLEQLVHTLKAERQPGE